MIAAVGCAILTAPAAQASRATAAVSHLAVAPAAHVTAGTASPVPAQFLGTYKIRGAAGPGRHRFQASMVLDHLNTVERSSALGGFYVSPTALRAILGTTDISYYLRFRGPDGLIALQAEVRILSSANIMFSVGVVGQGAEGPGLFGGQVRTSASGQLTVDYASYGYTGTLTATRTSL